MSEKTLNFLLSTVVPLVCAVGLIAMCIWGVEQRARADSYQIAAESMYKRSYNDLSDELNNLSVTLDKFSAVSSKTQYLLLLDDVWRRSGAVTSLLSQLPSSHVDTLATNRFITQVGDFAHSLSKKILKGATLSDEDFNQLASLSQSCSGMRDTVNERLAAETFPIEQLKDDQFYTASDGEYKENDGIDEFPTLIYDGPFSESTEKLEAKGVTGDEHDESACREKALAALPEGTSIELSSDNEGTIRAYDFSGNTQDGRSVDISVSKTGGHIVYFMSSATGNEEGKPDEETTARYKEAGLRFLQDAGYGEMEATYGQYYGGAALISYAAVQNGVILYNDLIKVYVDRQTEEIVGMDARNYLFSHTQRDIAEPACSVDEARGVVNASLQIVSERLALIPTTPSTETLCYEFKATLDETSYIVYINADTCDEEQVFVVIDSEDGSLVM